MKQALICFTKEPVMGKVKTRLARSIGDSKAFEIYKLLLENILTMQLKTSIKKFVSVYPYTKEYATHFESWECFTQIGMSFGARMAHAFEYVFAQGFERVVLIGGDIALIDAAIIDDAFASLVSSDAILGQTIDGGYYLIGFTKKSFTTKPFLIDFSHDVFAQTLTALNPLHVKLGKTLFDIDELADVRALHTLNLQTQLSLGIKKILQDLPKISVIIPVYFEKDNITKTILHLRNNAKDNDFEIILCDTPEKTTIDSVADLHVRTCLAPKASRSQQLNTGSAHACGEILLFVHADTLLPKDWDAFILKLYEEERDFAAAFKLGIKTENLFIKLIAFFANVRVFFTNTPYGDQAQSFSASVFHTIAGYDEIELMEDIAIIKKLHVRKKRVHIFDAKVFTSDRRWKKEGILYTTFRNRLLSILYFFGVSPKKLKRYYKFSQKVPLS
ncbi:MAG: TIGR04283 family arsenosugar biosynthesis glycosyltransferase [Sulfurospirillum sp.]|nr:TIGR04283 family arsenosugar biosynthesis glycosyltransferase [Sulfurospirillum sp.]